MPKACTGFQWAPAESARQKRLGLFSRDVYSLSATVQAYGGNQGLFGFGAVSKPSAMSSSGDSSISTTSGCRGSMVLRRS